MIPLKAIEGLSCSDYTKCIMKPRNKPGLVLFDDDVIDKKIFDFDDEENQDDTDNGDDLKQRRGSLGLDEIVDDHIYKETSPLVDVEKRLKDNVDNPG
jgi:hypothetical protein